VADFRQALTQQTTNREALSSIWWRGSLFQPSIIEGETAMTKEKKELYQEIDALKKILAEALTGKKFKLDCGHHFTGGTNLGNDITIRNGKHLTITCSLCGY